MDPAGRSTLKLCLGEDLKKIENAKVLVVGAGGIGCELLKNLVLTGFKNIEVIDLDTIDLSNLNRQFLFRREHIGKSKSMVARESVLRFNPECNIIAHHGNIKDSKFDTSYFKKFDIVMNALDNLAARQHVNRMCLATKKPLIESGTQGYLGQVTPILPYQSACFECTPPRSNNPLTPQPKQKTFAVCTIRSTPEKPVHCVVWAKHIFAVLFGPKDPDNMLSDLSVSVGGEGGGEEEEKEEETNGGGMKGGDSFGGRVFKKIFCEEVKKVLLKEKDWGSKAPPKPLDLDCILKSAAAAEKEAEAATLKLAEGAEEKCTSGSSCNARSSLRDQEVLSLHENVKEFLSTSATFDKDDEIAMDFVAATANLRMHGIAGNIIHAIATTNAMAAGLVVMEGIKVLTGGGKEQLKPKAAWIGDRGNIIQFQALEEPSKHCVVCGDAQMTIVVDRKVFTLEKLYGVLNNKLGMIEPSVNTLGGSYWGVKEENDEEALAKYLRDIFQDGEQLSIEDDAQDFSFNLLLSFDDLDEKEHPVGYILTTSDEELQKAKEKPNLERLGMKASSSSKKRSAPGGGSATDGDAAPASKRIRSGEAIVLT
eukprot:jgi/Bigna1/91267/estExt_fgenesh1_pg.C_940065